VHHLERLPGGGQPRGCDHVLGRDLAARRARAGAGIAPRQGPVGVPAGQGGGAVVAPAPAGAVLPKEEVQDFGNLGGDDWLAGINLDYLQMPGDADFFNNMPLF